MKTIDIINKVVEEAKTFPDPKIEYNLELPEIKGIKVDSFFGIPAIFNSSTPKNTAHVIFKY